MLVHGFLICFDLLRILGCVDIRAQWRQGHLIAMWQHVLVVLGYVISLVVDSRAGRGHLEHHGLGHWHRSRHVQFHVASIVGRDGILAKAQSAHRRVEAGVCMVKAFQIREVGIEIEKAGEFVVVGVQVHRIVAVSLRPLVRGRRRRLLGGHDRDCGAAS